MAAPRMGFASPFQVIRPTGEETPLVVEVPHASVYTDGPTLATLRVPAHCIGEDADMYVDELVASAPSEGATLLVANVSRYVVDLNRSEHDHDSASVENSKGAPAPHGLIWRRSTNGIEVLHQPLARLELERRLHLYYRPYHQTLRELIEEKKARFGYAVLLCAHSMPSRGPDRSGNVIDRADIVPGTRGRTSAAASFIDATDAEAQSYGFSIQHDEPYRGGFSTTHYGDPSRQVHAVQVEIARRLYMNETTLTTTERFAAIQKFCQTLIVRLGLTRPGVP